MVSVLSMGVMPLAAAGQRWRTRRWPASWSAAVGPWGAVLVNGGVALSLVGAMLGYTVLASESPYEAAVQRRVREGSSPARTSAARPS